MSIDALNDEITKPRGGKWVKLTDVGDKVVGTLIDAEIVERRDLDGAVVLGKKSGKPRTVARLRIQTDERLDGDDDGLRILDGNESVKDALRQIAPLEIGSLIAVQVTAAAPDKWSQATYRATSKPAPKVVDIPAAEADPFDGLI